MQNYSPDKIRNVAIVGHGGSGKTMLVEHMLYTAGATDRVGSTDAGNSQSDFDPIEIKLHHSLSASVVPLEWHGHKINLIDVPGFEDFIGDLRGVARVVDSMIIVCEAKRNLDAGFDAAWNIAEEFGLARCIFVNKLERDNADYPGLMETLHERYGRKIVGVQIPIGLQTAFCGVLDLLGMKVYKGKDRGVEIEDIPAGYADEANERREKMMDAAAEGDDDLAMKFLEGQELSAEEIEHRLLVGTETGRVVPVLLGSALSGIGIATLLDRIIGELPSPAEVSKQHEGKDLVADPSAPFSAFVFKSTADPYVGKISYMRVMTGTLKLDDTVWNSNKEHTERAHHLFYPHGKAQDATKEVVAGDICAIAKLAGTSTGDTLCSEKAKVMYEPISYPEPVYQVAIKPISKTDEDKLGPALTKILEEDPTLHYHRDSELHQEILEGLGDMHLEVAISKLHSRFGVSVGIEQVQIPYRETIRNPAKAQGRHKRQSGGKGQFGDCWIELEPLERGSGFKFDNKVVGGSIPKNFIPAVEKGIREAMVRGTLVGSSVVDFKATVYDGSYHDVDSNEMAFKMAAAIAFRAAVETAQAVLLEPIMEIKVDAPSNVVGDVVGDLNTRQALIESIDQTVERATVTAKVPMRTMGRYALDLRSISKGRAKFSRKFSHYQEMSVSDAKPLIEAHEKKRIEHESEH